MGGGGGVVAHVIIVSPQSQLDFGLVLGLGGLDLGLGLDGDEDSYNDDGKDIHTFTPTHLQP